MKNLNVPQPLSSGTSTPRFAAARALAFSLALDDPALHEPELVASHDYGVSDDGRLEVDVGGETPFIFADSSSFDSYAHFGPGAFHQHPRCLKQRDDLQNRRRGLRASRRLDQQADLSGRRIAGWKCDYRRRLPC